MKKLLVMVLMAVAIAMPSQAQVKFGLKGGLNLTNLSFDKDVEGNVSSRSGFFVGPSVKIGLPIGLIGFDIAALYDQREAKIKDPANHEETLKEQSIQIPVNVRFDFGLGDMASIFFFLGPQFGFNVGDKSKDFWGATEWTMNSSNLSGNIGLGVFLMNHLQVSANYNVALGKTGEFKSKSTGDQIHDTFKGKFNAWQIALAYYF